MCTIMLKQDDSNFVELKALRRAEPYQAPMWHVNWLKVQVRARAGWNKFDYIADVEISDLEQFLDEIINGPYEDEEVIALQTVEGGIEVFLKEVSATEFDAAFTLSPNGDDFGPHHQFKFMISKVCLDQVTEQLKRTLAIFPELVAVKKTLGPSTRPEN